MSHRHTLLMLGLLLAACQSPVATTGARHLLPPRAKSTAKPAASPSPVASTAIASQPPASIAPTSGPVTLLSGIAMVDAGYVISAGGGNVITAGGGNVITAGGGNVISAGGGNVISAGGGNVISAGGGNVISAGGGNVITAGGGNYRLVDFAVFPESTTSGASTTASGATPACAVSTGTPATVAIGTILPIHGLMIVPLSLKTGTLLGPATFSDEQGHYKVSIPQGTDSNVLLIAGIPGKSANDQVVKDPRMHYDLMVSPQASEQSTLDEDTTLVTAYCRQIIRDDLAVFITNPDMTNHMLANASGSPNVTPQMAALIPTIAEPYLARITCAQVPAKFLPSLADRFSDIIWGNATDIYKIPTQASKASALSAGYTPGPDEYALPALRAVFADIRTAAQSKWDCAPGFFASSNLQSARYIPHGQLQPGAAAVLKAGIGRPSDVVNFIIEQYLVGQALDFDDGLPALLQDLGVKDGDVVKPHLRAIGQSLVTTLGGQLLNPMITTQFDAAIAAFGQSASGTCPPASP